MSAASDFTGFIGTRKFATILADPPWQFTNRTGKVAPEHHRLKRYETVSLQEICAIPVQSCAESSSHFILMGAECPAA
jgi:hypothetical protein